jgi:hypothetical protein
LLHNCYEKYELTEAKSVTSKPKRPAVAAAGAHAAKLAKSKTATAVPKPTPERKASAEPPTARELVRGADPSYRKLPESRRFSALSED